VELLDPVDRHYDAQALLDLLTLHRREWSRPEVAVDPDSGSGVPLNVKIGAANLCHMSED
jgi:hypothetical protein